MSSALLTDFYQLTMAYSYWRLGIQEHDAVFHLFCRKNPSFSNYVVASGLPILIDYLNTFHFSESDIEYLSAHFPSDFLSYLKDLKFTGSIDAVLEGELVFPNEPLLRIQAPLIQAQLLETSIINMFNFSSGIATMASQMRSATGNDLLFEFGLRRAQGPNGGLTASRASFLGGFNATSNVLAGKEYSLPVVGTMAHSWVMAFDDELTAFREYAAINPQNVILLVDTYNTKKGVENAIQVGQELQGNGGELKGIRLDSGDIVKLSRMARTLLDQAGFTNTKIYASGELTLQKLRDFKEKNIPIDGWGVGTRLVTLYEQPALDIAYKLGAIHDGREWHYKLKVSESHVKTSEPGILQVRRYKKNAQYIADVLYHLDYELEDSEYDYSEYEDLLKPIFRKGECVYNSVSIAQSRAFCLENVNAFHQSEKSVYKLCYDRNLQLLKNKIMKAF